VICSLLARQAGFQTLAVALPESVLQDAHLSPLGDHVWVFFAERTHSQPVVDGRFQLADLLPKGLCLGVFFQPPLRPRGLRGRRLIDLLQLHLRQLELDVGLPQLGLDLEQVPLEQCELILGKGPQPGVLLGGPAADLFRQIPPRRPCDVELVLVLLDQPRDEGLPVLAGDLLVVHHLPQEGLAHGVDQHLQLLRLVPAHRDSHDVRRNGKVDAYLFLQPGERVELAVHHGQALHVRVPQGAAEHQPGLSQGHLVPLEFIQAEGRLGGPEEGVPPRGRRISVRTMGLGGGVKNHAQAPPTPPSSKPRAATSILARLIARSPLVGAAHPAQGQIRATRPHRRGVSGRKKLPPPC
jgi:hypothetical protein